MVRLRNLKKKIFDYALFLSWGLKKKQLSKTKKDTIKNRTITEQSMGSRVKTLEHRQANTVKPVSSDHTKNHRKLVFNIGRSKELQNAPIILQYFRPSLGYHIPLRPFFCRF